MMVAGGCVIGWPGNGGCARLRLKRYARSLAAIASVLQATPIACKRRMAAIAVADVGSSPAASFKLNKSVSMLVDGLAGAVARSEMSVTG